MSQGPLNTVISTPNTKQVVSLAPVCRRGNRVPALIERRLVQGTQRKRDLSRFERTSPGLSHLFRWRKNPRRGRPRVLPGSAPLPCYYLNSPSICFWAVNLGILSIVVKMTSDNVYELPLRAPNRVRVDGEGSWSA